MNLKWSKEVHFRRDAINGQFPREPGVYRVIQSKPYSRYKGETRTLKIGQSETDLAEEIIRHLVGPHTAKNRLARIRSQPDLTVTVQCILPQQSPTELERKLLRDFEDKHWELPLLNSQRGYRRNEDVHYADIDERSTD